MWRVNLPFVREKHTESVLNTAHCVSILQDARLVLADTNSDGTVGSHFEIVNDGTANTYPALSITDGTYTMMQARHTATTRILGYFSRALPDSHDMCCMLNHWR